ncbi:diguanylate cyclase domain-containing protein [Kineococcus sp. R86509]|uniref:diguanylate cyclase domain-containing protein n=1 Tax=Kineococcus sp. R86509 TaxID=3093851 RepID=UPI0036D2713F
MTRPVLRRALRRPEGLIARTRWLFCGSALVSLALTLPGAVVGERGSTLVGLALASTVLCAVWLRRYRVAAAHWYTDLLEAAASAAFAACASSPQLAFGFAFTAMWQRAVYGSWRCGVVHAVLVAGALLTSLVTWPLLPGHPGSVVVGGLLGPLPLTLLISAVARHLAGSLFAREQATGRQAALAGLSAALLTATTREEIVRLAWVATEAVCSATPGSHALGVEERAGRTAVHTSTGLQLPASTPWDRDALAGTDEPAPVSGPLLQRLQQVGHADRWISLALPAPGGRPTRWIVVGESSRTSSGEVSTAVRAVSQQAVLALRGREQHDDLVRAARTDGLTGLANRSTFTLALEQELRAGADGTAVLFCDLDGFKPVNDELGHAAGDELLRRVADRLRRTLRPGDLCARLGGDEFVVLLRIPEGDVLQVATAVAHRVVDRVSEPIALDGRTVQVGISVGLALAGPDVDAHRLLRNADHAMYTAKVGGKNRFHTFATP